MPDAAEKGGQKNQVHLPAHCWVTSETGLLKAVNLAKRTATNYYDGVQPTKGEAICRMANATTGSILTVSASGKVKTFSKGEFTTVFDSKVDSGCVFLHQQPDTTSSPIVHAYKTGQVFVNDTEIYQVTKLQNAETGSPTHYLTTGAVLKSNKNTVVLGGNEVLPQAIDTETGKEIWSAKNVAHSWLDLRVPVWQKQIIADSSDAGSSCFYSATAYGFIRKYDTRCGKRPTHQTSVRELGSVPDFDEIFTSLSQMGDTHELVVGGNRGSTLLLDSREFPTTKSVQSLKPKEGRNSKAVVHKFRPSDGGVASITAMSAAGETPDLVATCGADRKLRIYEKGNGKMSHMVYLKSKLTQVCMVDGSDFISEQKRIADEACVEKAKNQDSEEEDEPEEVQSKRRKEDELWEQLLQC